MSSMEALMVWKLVTISFNYLWDDCNAFFPWNSSSVLWTNKLHPTFQHEGDNLIFICRWTILFKLWFYLLQILILVSIFTIWSKCKFLLYSSLNMGGGPCWERCSTNTLIEHSYRKPTCGLDEKFSYNLDDSRSYDELAVVLYCCVGFR